MHFVCEEDEEQMHECSFLNNEDYVSSHELNFVNLIWTFCVTMRATDWFSTLNSTRQLFMILKVSAQDIVAFSIITVYIMYVFTVIKQYQALING